MATLKVDENNNAAILFVLFQVCFFHDHFDNYEFEEPDVAVKASDLEFGNVSSYFVS